MKKVKKLVGAGVLIAVSTGMISCQSKTEATNEPNKVEPNKDKQETENNDANQESFTEEKGEEEAIKNGKSESITGKYCSYLLITYDEAKNGTVTNVENSVLNVRVEPSLTAEVVNRLVDGTTLKVVGKAGDWYQVILEGSSETFFVHSNYVKVDGLPYNYTHNIEVNHSNVVNKKPNNNVVQSRPTTSGGNKPNKPSKPSQPEQPSQPSQPSKPSEPSQPSQPSEPSKPEHKNEAPVITGDDLIIKGLGAEFSLDMLNLKATDAEDGDLTDSIKVLSNNVDTEKEGKYTVKVAVTDKSGATTELELSVEVIAENNDIPAEGLNAAPVITGNDITIMQGSIFNISDLEIKVSDAEDTEIGFEVVKNNVTVSKPGTYEVVVKATDKQGASCTKTFKVTVLAKTEDSKPADKINAAPTLTVKNQQVNLKVNEKWSLDLHGVTANDAEDGAITDIKVNGTVDTSTVGTKFIEISVKDSKGATTKTTLTVVVSMDATALNNAPTLNVENEEVSIRKGDAWNISMHGVTANDTEDGKLEVKVSGTVDTNTLGTQHVVVYAVDKQGAKTSRQLTINVVKPKNSAPIITADNVVIKQGQKYDVSMHNAKATDAEEGTLTHKITYTTDVDTSRYGIYHTTFTVKDSEGLSTSITVEVQVTAVAPTIVSKDVFEIQQYTGGVQFEDLGITAHDASGRDITDRIEAPGFSNINFNVAGDYPIELMVTDYQAIVAYKKIIIRVVPPKDAMSPQSAEFNKIVSDEMTRLLNEYRVSKGRTAIPAKAIAIECAEKKIDHMVEYKYFDHTYEGKFIWDIYPEYMYAYITGENLQLTSMRVNKEYTVEEAKAFSLQLFNSWKNSATHNAMMLSDWNTGFGFAFRVFDNGRVMAVQEFMSE